MKFLVVLCSLLWLAGCVSPAPPPAIRVLSVEQWSSGADYWALYKVRVEYRGAVSSENQLAIAFEYLPDSGISSPRSGIPIIDEKHPFIATAATKLLEQKAGVVELWADPHGIAGAGLKPNGRIRVRIETTPKPPLAEIEASLPSSSNKANQPPMQTEGLRPSAALL